MSNFNQYDQVADALRSADLVSVVDYARAAASQGKQELVEAICCVIYNAEAHLAIDNVLITRTALLRVNLVEALDHVWEHATGRCDYETATENEGENGFLISRIRVPCKAAGAVRIAVCTSDKSKTTFILLAEELGEEDA